METFEIAWFSSAFIVAFLVYTLEPFEPRGIPIQANGRTIRVPDKFADNMSEISAFAAEFELALKKAVPDLKAASGSLWTARLIRGKRPEVEKALQGMDEYVILVSGITIYVVNFLGLQPSTRAFCSA